MRPLSSSTQKMPRSGIRVLFDKANKIPDAIHLEIGQPNFDTPRHIISAAYEAAIKGYTGYTANAGLESLRVLLAKKVERENDIPAEIDNIIVTTGGMGGIFCTFIALFEPGDEVLIPDPGYPNYEQLVYLCRLKSTRYPLYAEKAFIPQQDDITSLINPSTKAIVVNSPSNPCGGVFGIETTQMLLDIALEYDLFIISDECYEKVVFEGCHFSPAVWDRDGRVISIFSFSKTYAMTGWRVGYVVANRELVDVMAKIQEPTVACVSSISQKAAEAALIGPQDCIEIMVDSYRKRRDEAVSIMEYYKVLGFVPKGAFYILLDISDCGQNSYEVAERILSEKKVAVAPGGSFGPMGDNFIRVSLATSENELNSGMERICQWIVEQST